MKEELRAAQQRIQDLLDEKNGVNTGSSAFSQQNDGKPRAGVLPPEVAEAHHMMELMPKSSVFLYPKDMRIVSKKPSGCRKARFLLSVFYTNEELVTAGNITGANEKKGLDKRVIDAILDYAVVKSDDKLGDLKLALRNKVSALVFATQKKQQKQTAV